LAVSAPTVRPEQGTQLRELYLFALYRLLEAGMLALVVFNPIVGSRLDSAQPFAGQGLAIAYLVLAIGLLLQARSAKSVRWPTLVGAGIDILFAAAATALLPAIAPGVALMLLFNIGAAALLLPLRLGMGVAGAASVALAGIYLWSLLSERAPARPLAEVMMFAVSFLAIAALSHQLRQRVDQTQALADRRGAEATRLAEINELIIRRMRTGVLLVDRDGEMKLANEAAMLLLGEGAVGTRVLAQAAPELALRLTEWLRSGVNNEAPMRMGHEQFELVPRFARLLANSDNTLIFLDDTSLVSRRAESLTLAAMGRFSASLAHEIRNPLAAISYAAQLLEESHDIVEGDRRMVQIIHQQCMRTNSIVESVLGLARRERATAEHIELVGMLRAFIEEFKQTVPDETDNISLDATLPNVSALVDSRHLHQVLTALVQNARRHGHQTGEAARITLHVYKIEDTPVIDVIDAGPGISETAISQLFRPFFTTSQHGTGLGLYIARELCRANGASLDHVPKSGGGCCFRITLPGLHALLPA
jgi:two-component system sensor histidine kinase PilS (NtrC family)